MKTAVFQILIMLFTINIFAQNYQYDVKFFCLNIEVNPAIDSIKGKATTYFKAKKENLNTITFDFEDNMTVDSIIFRQQKVNYIHQNDFLDITLPVELELDYLDSISVYYQGNPESSGFGSFVTSTHNSNPIMWTLSEPYGAKAWMPCKQTLNDKTDSLDLIVTVPIGNRVAANGLLFKIDTLEQQITFHWKHRYPITAYLIAFAVTNYAEYYDYVNIGDSLTIPILNYVYPESLTTAQSSTPDITDVFQFYCDTFMLYPFWEEKYGQAQFNWGGGMEHQTMTFVGGFYHSLMAHELAHQWFGDYITLGSWQDIWLNEGFAVYLEGMTAELGLAPYNWDEWKASNIASVTSLPDGSVFCSDTTSVSRIFNYRLTYMKGGMILHLLRWIIGDRAFFDAIRNYLNDPKLAYGYAKVDDLKNHFEQECGCDLTYFFDDWYYGEGFPLYSVYWSQNEQKKVSLTIFQSQSTSKADFFVLPIAIKLIGQNKDSIIVVNNTYSGQKFEFDLNFTAENLIFDPDKWIITQNTTISKILTKDTNELFLLPNPVDDILTVKMPYQLYLKNYSVYDSNGSQVLFEKIMKNQELFKINVSDLQKGTYLLYILTSSGTYSDKFVKN